jgi:hypothetical protein
LRDFARKYPRPQILITCRVAATDYTFRGFRYVELADFNEGQMHAFVRKWFRDEDELAEQFWQEYQRDENEGLRELGQVPLLLALLCMGYEATLAFPNRRVDLYEEALDALLKKWDASRRIRRDEIYKNLALGRKQQLLAELAATYFQEGRYFFEQRDLASRIADYLRKLPDAPKEGVDGEAVLRAIEAQHGILVERARHIHAFAHLTFQEYYTAKYVVDNALEGTIPRLMRHVTEDRWREVFLLAASLLPKADIFFKHFLEALDDLVAGDDALLEFLAWVVRKAGSVETSTKPVDVRALYAKLAFDFARDRALFLVLNFTLAAAREDTSEPLLDLALALTLARLRIFGIAVELAIDLGEDALAQDLEDLEMPERDAESGVWDAFTADLQGLMIKHRDIGHDWAFTPEQIQTLDHYLDATHFLLECLDVAYVTDREAIEDRLLRPPRD